jgi:transcriptional regulator with XRE-family HTH domain
MKRRAPTDLDRFIGQRIREGRLSAGISQTDLADMLGVSYQQIQKYEAGDNRIAVSRFGRISTALNRPLGWFFPNSTDVRASPSLGAVLATKYGLVIANNLPSLPLHWQAWVADTVQRLAKEHRRD